MFGDTVGGRGELFELEMMLEDTKFTAGRNAGKFTLAESLLQMSTGERMDYEPIFKHNTGRRFRGARYARNSPPPVAIPVTGSPFVEIPHDLAFAKWKWPSEVEVWAPYGKAAPAKVSRARKIPAYVSDSSSDSSSYEVLKPGGD